MARIRALLLFAFIPAAGFCQVRAVDLYQYNYTSISPAFAGVDGTKITAMGNVIAPKSDFAFTNGNFYDVFAGFETKIGKYGTGITTSIYDGYGVISMLHVSVPINYQWDLGPSRKLVIGLRPSFARAGLEHRGHQSGFNNSVGALYKMEKFYVGLSADNIIHSQFFDFPDFTNRQYNLILGKNFKIGPLLSSEHSLYAAWIEQLDWKIDLNNTFIIARKILLGASLMISYDTYAKVNGGWRFGDLGQAIVSLYSGTNTFPGKKFSGQVMLQLNLRKRSSV